MKLEMSFTAEVRNILQREYTTKENKKAVAYKIGFELNNGEMGHIACTAKVAQKFGKDIVKGDMCCFLAEYNTDFNRLYIVGMSLYTG